MKNFSFYEQSGIIIPGAVFLFGVVILFPDLHPFFEKDGITIGGLGVFLLIAYAAGHGIAAVGNLLEHVWWWVRGGMPSDWVTHDPPKILSARQMETLLSSIKGRFGVKVERIAGMSRKEWGPIFGQIYRDVLVNNPGRIETFNGNYGLNRGIAAALLSLAAIAEIGFPNRWLLALGLVLLALIYVYRMQRFGNHFAKEVYLGFLNVSRSPQNNKNSAEGISDAGGRD